MILKENENDVQSNHKKPNELMNGIDNKVMGKYESKRQNHESQSKSQLNDNVTADETTQSLRSQIRRKNNNPFTVTIEINIIAWILFVVAFAMRFWRIDYPKSIVFDELHYGKFVSLYLKGIFFFDSQPPFGKQLIAMSAYVAGYNGDGSFASIGGSFDESVPLKALRFVPAFCGSLIIPLIYYIMIEIGLKHRTAALTSLLILFENSLLTQSRFILMESILIFFTTFGLFSFLKCRKKCIFSVSWTVWIIISSVSLTLGLCVKYIGIVSLFIVIGITLYDFWWRIADRSVKVLRLWFEIGFYIFNFIILPLIVYIGIFYIHLNTLTNAGPHDTIMTSAFQASLEGGLASITKGQPLEIAHGSQITLRHTHGRTCWLHSHQAMYPIRYTDKRGSSHQQQVTCYSFKDVNNWWIIKRPEINDLVVSEPIDRIKNGDIIQLIHGVTGRALNSHDVAAPMSPQNQEVSCYVDYNISMASQSLWKVQLINGDETNNYWHTISSRVHLIHINSSQTLKFSGKQLPDWGFNQHEVVTDKIIKQDDTVWNVEEHRYSKKADAKERERDMGMAEFVPLKPTQLSFWDKMFELQYKMLIVNQENVQEHVYSCDSPLDFITLKKGIAYWISPQSNAQIHLIGNIVLWHLASASIFLYVLLYTFYLIRRKRKFYDIPEERWSQMVNFGQIFVLSYISYIVPHFLTDKTLFLHHYLPALIFKLMLLGAIFEHITIWVPLRIINLMLFLLMLSVTYTFVKLLPLSYGTVNLSANDVINLKWKESWQLIIHQQ